MKPENSQGGGVSNNANQPQQNAAAADLIRHQIDSLYDHDNGQPSQPTPTTQAPTSVQRVIQPVSQPAQTTAQTSPFQRTYTAANPESARSDQWKQYHSAWQNYYQQYYEQYYAHHTKTQRQGYFSQQPEPQPAPAQETLTKDEALQDLRSQLLAKVQDSAKKVRKSRHFMPIFATAIVVFIFVFVQYNRAFIASVNAYVSPGAISPQNIVVDPIGDTEVTKESRLIIPKINVDVPVMYDVGIDHDSQMKAMENGVAHFPIPGANSHPGELGNTVLAGHSSNDLFGGGDYKFIFARLDKMQKGDTLYANYNGVRYTYVVTKTEVVKPNEVNKLIYKTNVPVMTLITCTPLGTALNRLLITAEQVSPDPAKASAAPAGSGTASGGSAILPSNEPTFLERLFGRR